MTEGEDIVNNNTEVLEMTSDNEAISALLVEDVPWGELVRPSTKNIHKGAPLYSIFTKIAARGLDNTANQNLTSFARKRISHLRAPTSTGQAGATHTQNH